MGSGGKANFEKSFITVIGHMTVARGKKYSIMSCERKLKIHEIATSSLPLTSFPKHFIENDVFADLH